MNLADKIREMVELVDPASISETLSIPQEIVEGVLNGTIDETELQKFDPSHRIKIVEKRVISRGQVIAVLENEALAAEIALYLSKKHSVALIDVCPYPIIPIYVGMTPAEIPQFVNMLWDEFIDEKPYKENLYVYTQPHQTSGIYQEVINRYPISVINFPLARLQEINNLADVVYLPTCCNLAGVYRLKQILANNDCTRKAQLAWINSPGDNKYLSILRGFTQIPVAGQSPDCLNVNPGKYQKEVKKILEPLFPENRKKIFGII